MKKTKRLVLLAMLTAVAMILSYVESLLPSVGIPGVKMGLANIAVIFALFRFGWKEAAALNSAEYQDRLAWTIHMGVMEYLNGQ